MKPTLEEYVSNLKADLAKEIAKREESELKHSIVCEALEDLLEGVDNLPRVYISLAPYRQAARKALNGVVEGV